MNIRIYSPHDVDFEKISSDEKSLSAFSDKIASLGEAARYVLLSADTPYFLEALSLNNDLTEAQAENLSRIIRDTLFADLFINDMAPTIAQKLNISTDTAKKIRDKIVNELFAPAADDIRKMQREKFPDRVGPGTPTSAQPAAPRPAGTAGPSPDVNENNIIDLRQPK